MFNPNPLAMNIRRSHSLETSHKERIFELWQSEFTSGVSYESMAAFEAYLIKWENPMHFVLMDSQGELQGWLFAFDRDGDRWFSMLLDPAVQGKGYGSKLLEAAKAVESQLNGWVVDHDRHLRSDGKAYRSPIDFYLKNGFEVKADERFETEQLSGVKLVWRKKNP